MLKKFAPSRRFEELRLIARDEPDRYLRMSHEIKMQLALYLLLRHAAEQKARAA